MKNNSERLSDILSWLDSISYIKTEKIPEVDLYMDQVTTFMDEHLQDCKRKPDDKILTKTMINNYTKNNLLPAPIKKKYSKDHLYILAFIYYFKSILSINDIKTILDPITEQFFDKEKYYAQKQEYLNQKINMKNMEKRISLTYGDIFRIIIKINGFSLQLQNGLQL